MNDNQFNHRARRAARKQGKKLGRKLTPEEIKKLKIQTAPLWSQIVMTIAGFLLVFGGVYLFLGGNYIIGSVLVVVGILIVSLGIVGKKETVEEIAGEILVKPVEFFIEGILSSF